MQQKTLNARKKHYKTFIGYRVAKLVSRLNVSRSQIYNLTVNLEFSVILLSFGVVASCRSENASLQKRLKEEKEENEKLHKELRNLEKVSHGDPEDI